MNLCGGTLFYGFVLIETLWNVKVNIRTGDSPFAIVLIETLWNVKLPERKERGKAPGINRNIVECKVCN